MCVSVPGVVHAHPGQNLLKRLILRVVTMFDLVFVMTLLLGDVTHFSIWLLNCFVLSYPSSASIQMDHLTPSGQFDMSFLYWFLGALTSSKPPEKWTMKKTWKKTKNCVQWRTISRHTLPMVATSGFGHSPRPLPLGNVLGIVPADCQGQQNGRQVWCFFSFFPLHATPLSATRAIQREHE